MNCVSRRHTRTHLTSGLSIRIVVISAGIFDMGQRFFEDRMKRAGVSFSEMWSKAHEGRFWKRQLSKARRKAAKRLCRYGEDDLAKVERGLPQIERECNYKRW